MVGASATASQAALSSAGHPYNLRALAQGLNNASWSLRGTRLLEDSSQPCGFFQDACRTENIHATLLLLCLCAIVVLIICAFAFFRHDKEEMITPLCPPLVVRENVLNFTLELEEKVESFIVADFKGEPVCRVAIDCPDPFRTGCTGVAATARVQNVLGQTLATVVARRGTDESQSLALCRAGCEIFGFVVHESPGRFVVRHRTGVHLIALIGDFGNLEVDGINPVGSKVCGFTSKGAKISGYVLQHVDAGLVISAMIAILVSRRLALAEAPPQLPPHRPLSPALVEEAPAPETECATLPAGHAMMAA
mmetsp:Transcript_35759/g.76253  ORF Transcript_35759/g.76253 Transcript_35759/m.76253 type:complete len:308 (+) Transcript_35759:138-1061(+)